LFGVGSLPSLGLPPSLLSTVPAPLEVGFADDLVLAAGRKLEEVDLMSPSSADVTLDGLDPTARALVGVDAATVRASEIADAAA
jgi:hypothetical protein